MTLEVADVRRSLSDPRRVAVLLGLERGALRMRGGLAVCCPWHKEQTPSCSLSTGRDGTLRVRCFGCGETGDVLTLVAEVRGLDLRRDFKAVLEEAAVLAGVELPPERLAPSSAPARELDALEDDAFDELVRPVLNAGRLDGSQAVSPVVRYLAGRGLLDAARADGWAALPEPGQGQAARLRFCVDVFGADLVERSGLATRRRGDLAWAWPRHLVCIPWRTPAGLVQTVQRRRLDPGEPKYVFPSGRRPRFPYGVEQLRRAPATAPVVFVEGAVDALARRVLDVGRNDGRVVLGVPGVDGWRAEFAALARGRVAYVATDADEAGERVVDRWSEDLYAAGAREVRRLAPPAGSKDWCDALGARRAAA